MSSVLDLASTLFGRSIFENKRNLHELSFKRYRAPLRPSGFTTIGAIKFYHRACKMGKKICTSTLSQLPLGIRY